MSGLVGREGRKLGDGGTTAGGGSITQSMLQAEEGDDAV